MEGRLLVQGYEGDYDMQDVMLALERLVQEGVSPSRGL